MHSTGTLAAALLALAAHTAAVKIPFTHLARRAPTNSFKVLASTAPSSHAATSVANVFDNLYLATITLGDRQFNVQIDTGSSDLWVKAGAPATSFNATDLALPAVNITYGLGSVSGTPATAKFTFGSYAVDEQAFLDVTAADMGNLFASGADGVLGLSFNSASAIKAAVAASKAFPASKGQSVLASIFAQSPAARDYITFSLGRTGDLDTTSSGTFSISEVDPKFAAVDSAPALPVFANKNAGALQRWTVPVDAVTIAGVTYNATTAVKNASGKQLALLDTGSSLVLLPAHTITAIYSSIPGAVYDKDVDLWFVPCLNQTAVSFVFGGQSVLVHPLDLTKPSQAALKDGTIVTYCVNNFQVNKVTTEFDVVLGDAFLRNVFALYDFGDVDATGKITSAPFVKLLGVTDKASAPQDFIESRKQALELLPPLAPLGDAVTFAAVKSFVLESAAKSTSTASTTAAAKPSHKTTHKIGFSGKKGTTTKVKSVNKPIIAIASGTQNDASDPSGTGISSQVQKLLDFSPILLGLLAANVILGVGLCILGGYILRSNRAKKLRREPTRRAGTDGTVVAAYEPVGMVDRGAPSPLPYRDSVAVEEGAGTKDTAKPLSYRDSGVAFGDTEAARRAGPSVETGDLGLRENSPFLDANGNSPGRASFTGGRDSIALSDGGPVPRPGAPFPSGGAERLSVVASDGQYSRRQSRVPSAASASRDSTYSQAQGSPFRSPSHDSLHTTGGGDGGFAPPQPAFAGGRQPRMPSPGSDSPNGQLPLPGPGVGLRPVPNRQPSMESRSTSMYEVPQTSEHQLGSQQRRYSHVPPAAMAGVPLRPSQFNPNQPYPAVPPRSPARSIPGPPPPMPPARPPSA